MMPKADVRLNQRGYRCPMPIVAIGRAAREASSITVIAVTCTDEGAKHDIPAWCELKGVEFLGSEPEADGAVTYFVRTR